MLFHSLPSNALEILFKLTISRSVVEFTTTTTTTTMHSLKLGVRVRAEELSETRTKHTDRDDGSSLAIFSWVSHVTFLAN